MRSFLNSISQDKREEIAQACGSSVGYFWQIAGGHRTPSTRLARKIEKYTGGSVTIQELRPEDYCELEQESAA